MIELNLDNSYIYRERYHNNLRCIYALKDRRFNEFRYIGNTKQPTIRFRQYVRGDFMSVSVPVKQWINTIGSENLIMAILMQVEPEESENLEYLLIQHLFSQGLLNQKLKTKSTNGKTTTAKTDDLNTNSRSSL